ncbi:MAG: glycosyltransferase [Candidatus Sericytochromatia bacterium]
MVNNKLVSIIIPAYKYEFFEEALLSAVNQTYKNIEIIICDDSAKEKIEYISKNIIEKYKDIDIKYYKNPINIGGEANYIKCFELSKGEYIKYLNDDDILLNNCVEEMVNLFEKYGDKVNLISSIREFIDEKSIKINNNIIIPAFVDKKNNYSYINGKQTIDYILSNLKNEIGEPSTFMFRKKTIENIKPNIFSIYGTYLLGNVDITMFINLLSTGDLIYINKVLSYFRVSSIQAQANPYFSYLCSIHWFNSINLSRKLDYLSEKKELNLALNNLSDFYERIISKNDFFTYIKLLKTKKFNIKLIITLKNLIKKVLYPKEKTKLDSLFIKDLYRKCIIINNEINNNKIIKKTHICPVCCNNVHDFIPLPDYYENKSKKYGFNFKSAEFETLNDKKYLCYLCSSSDRDRLYALYILTFLSEKNLFEKYNFFDLSRINIIPQISKLKFIRRFFKFKINRINQIINSKEKLKLIDFAPSSPLSKFIKSVDMFEYRTADLFMKNVDDKIDLCNMSYKDNSFDIFICSHILEHVIDDKKALSELYRILKNNGWGILMVPICLSIEKTLEGIDNGTIEERWKYYGQDDHVRLYSKKDFIKKIIDTGFKLEELDKNFFGEETLKIFGISNKSILYIVTKSI